VGCVQGNWGSSASRATAIVNLVLIGIPMEFHIETCTAQDVQTEIFAFQGVKFNSIDDVDNATAHTIWMQWQVVV